MVRKPTWCVNRKHYNMKRYIPRKAKAIVLTITLALAGFTTWSQNGPGGVGNLDGTDGQPRLVMWLDASSLSLSNNDPVSVWGDVSGNANDATQPTATNQPLFKTNQINGKPAIIFDFSA